MTLIEIITLLAAITTGVLYWSKRNKAKELEKEIESNESLIKIKDETLEVQKKNYLELEKTQKAFQDDLMRSNEENRVLIKRNSELQSLYDNATNEIRQLISNINEIQKSNFDPKPVRLEDLQYELEYKGQITWTTLEINIALLIGDNRLFDVFKKLLNSKLLPESIQEQIDFQLDGLNVAIWCQHFDPDGNPHTSLTWFEIIEQIINKKRIITDYLNGVIQESNRAMVVHQALSEKPKKESEVASA